MLESCKFGDLALLKYWYEGQRRLSTSLSRDGTCLALLYGRHTVVNWFLEGPTFPHDDPHLLTHAVIGGDATLIDLLLAKGGRVHPLALKAASLRLSPSLIRSLESHLDPKTILDVDNLPEVNKIALLYGARPGLARFIVSLSEANLLTEPMLDLPFILRFLLEEGSILFNFEATETAILDNRWELVKVICKVQRLPPWSEASSTIGQNVWYRDRVQSLHGVIANALTSTSDINAMHLRYFLDRDFVEISQLHLNSILKSPIAESNWELVRAILDSTKLRNKLQILISDAPTPIFERVFWEYQEQIIPLITGRLLFLFPKERLEWALFGAKIIPITPRLAVDLFLGGLFDVVSKIVPSMVSSIAIPIASVFDRSSNRGDDLFKHFLEMFPRGWATLLHSDADVAQFVSEYDDLLQLVQIGCVQWSMSLESAIISRGNIPLLIRLLLLQNEDTIPLPLHPEIIPPLVEIVYRFDWNAAISSRFGINFSLSDTLESARNRRWGLVNLGLHKHDQLLTLELRQELVMEAMRGNAPIFFRDDKSSELHDLLMTFDFATLREFVEDSWYSNLSIHVLVFAFMRGLELDVERVVRKICSGNGGAIFSYSHSDMKAWDEIFQFHDVDLTVFYDCKTAPMDPLKAQSYSGHITLDAQAADFFLPHLKVLSKKSGKRLEEKKKNVINFAYANAEVVNPTPSEAVTPPPSFSFSFTSSAAPNLSMPTPITATSSTPFSSTEHSSTLSSPSFSFLDPSSTSVFSFPSSSFTSSPSSTATPSQHFSFPSPTEGSAPIFSFPSPLSTSIPSVSTTTSPAVTFSFPPSNAQAFPFSFPFTPASSSSFQTPTSTFTSSASNPPDSSSSSFTTNTTSSSSFTFPKFLC